MVSIRSGAFALVGLLDGRRTTARWRYAAALAPQMGTGIRGVWADPETDSVMACQARATRFARSQPLGRRPVSRRKKAEKFAASGTLAAGRTGPSLAEAEKARSDPRAADGPHSTLAEFVGGPGDDDRDRGPAVPAGGDCCPPTASPRLATCS
jgi:hypothetical protein